MSAAKPKIADYPFTTLHPNLGVVESGETRYTVADVPGLIEGASEGKGLGLEFLRHVERCTALLHVLDCATLEPGRDPISDLDIILGELAAYPVPEGQLPLLERPQLIALNKIDVPEGRELAELRPRRPRGARLPRVRDLRGQPRGAARTVASRSPNSSRPTAPRRPQPSRSSRASSSARVPSTKRSSRHASRAAPTATSTGHRREARALGGRRPTSPTTRPSASSPIALPSSASRSNSSSRELSPDRLCIIGEGDGVVFDWEPTLTSSAELVTAPRGTDARLDENDARDPQEAPRELPRADGRERAAARAELRAERDAGIWNDDEGFAIQPKQSDDEESEARE